MTAKREARVISELSRMAEEWDSETLRDAVRAITETRAELAELRPVVDAALLMTECLEGERSTGAALKALMAECEKIRAARKERTDEKAD